MKSVKCFIFLLALVTFQYACTAQNNSKQEISDQDSSLKVEIVRFDKDLYNYLQAPSGRIQDSLRSKYGNFLEAYGAVVINHSDVNDSVFFGTLEKYFSNDMLSKIYKDELDIFDNIERYNLELTSANNLIDKYFSGKKLPVLALHTSGFKENVIVTDSLISISADKYLGENYAYYPKFFESYQLIQMNPAFMVRDFLKAWLITESAKNKNKKILLSEIINEGKIIYALSKILPNWSVNQLIGYTDQQLKWANDNEQAIWNTVLQKKYLFSSDSQIINKFVNDAPFTPLVSSNSPGRLGIWLGYQIVDKYMHNTDQSLPALLSEQDYQKILKLSKYNP